MLQWNIWENGQRLAKVPKLKIAGDEEIEEENLGESRILVFKRKQARSFKYCLRCGLFKDTKHFADQHKKKGAIYLKSKEFELIIC